MIKEIFIPSLVILPTLAGIPAAVYRKLGLLINWRLAGDISDPSYCDGGLRALSLRPGAWTLR
jgi:hypothetical protein